MSSQRVAAAVQKSDPNLTWIQKKRQREIHARSDEIGHRRYKTIEKYLRVSMTL